MTSAVWYIFFGGVFILMGLASSVVKRLPLTTSLVYLGLGVALGPHVLGLFYINPIKYSSLLERATEVVVIISLFSAGLKLRRTWNDEIWKIVFRLSFVSMFITVVLVSVAGIFILQLPLGAAILLGGILAPTDPVLASDVQVKHPGDQDRLRFAITGEAGLNDGVAFPFVMLGLGLLGLHDIGSDGAKWLLFDVLWAIPGGLLIGGALGTVVSHLVIRLRKHRKETVLLDDFLALGLIALSYGMAILFKSYGFLAVFAAGLAIRRTERKFSGEKISSEVKGLAALGQQEEIVASSPEKVPAYTAQAILFFNEQLERLGEVGMVVLLGGMVWITEPELHFTWLIPILFLLIRPISVQLGLWGSATPRSQINLMAWFGIRGIGSLYYLMFAIEQGLPVELAQKLTSTTLWVIAASIFIHGISVTPLMNVYQHRSERTARLKKTA